VADVAGKSIPVAGRACDKGPFSAEPLQCADLGNMVDVPMAPVAGHEPRCADYYSYPHTRFAKILNDYRPLRCFEQCPEFHTMRTKTSFGWIKRMP
jgi:hypothetical protein